MKIHVALFSIFAVISMTACSSAESKNQKAQAEYTNEKTETLKDYKKCVKDSDGDEAKMSKCEALLKAVEAVEGGK